MVVAHFFPDEDQINRNYISSFWPTQKFICGGNCTNTHVVLASFHVSPFFSSANCFLGALALMTKNTTIRKSMGIPILTYPKGVLELGVQPRCAGTDGCAAFKAPTQYPGCVITTARKVSLGVPGN